MGDSKGRLDLEKGCFWMTLTRLPECPYRSVSSMFQFAVLLA